MLQPVTGYLRLALVFAWNSALRGEFGFYFSGVFLLGLTKFSFWQGDCTLGYHSIWFGHFPDPKSYFVRQLLRQLLYTMFISNNRASFHLWWRGNWVKHQKVSKYYESNYRILWTSLGTKLTFLIFLVPLLCFSS